MKKEILILICLFFCFSAFCQYTSGNVSQAGVPKEGHFGTDKLLPSFNSPTASAFKNYISYPQVSNNGAINISAPLYTIKQGDLSHNIGLSYNSKGIKVNSKASWVGTGWSLRAGGVITRTVKDIPDGALYSQASVFPWVESWKKKTVYGWLNQNNYKTITDLLTEGSRISDFPASDISIYGNVPYPSNPPTWEDERNVWRTLNILRGDYSQSVFDLEPDLYHFSLGDESFDFVFTEEGYPKIIGLADYKIEYDMTMADSYIYDSQINSWVSDHLTFPSDNIGLVLSRFIITNPQGYKYYFEYEDVEKTTRTDVVFSFFSGGTEVGNSNIGANVYTGGERKDYKEQVPRYTSAWFLSKIESPSGQELHFDYHNEEIIDKPRIPVFLGGTLNPNDAHDDTKRSSFRTLLLTSEHMSRRAEYKVSSKFLSRIYYKNSSSSSAEIDLAIFNLGSDREDSNGGKTLSSIDIYSNNNIKIKSFDLSYYYRTADDCPSFATDEKWCKRLYLDKIEEVFSPTKKITQFEFEYNLTNLPHRFSNEQDFWGYYNENNATSLIPKLYAYPNNSGMDVYRIYSGAGGTEYELPGANRDVVPAKAKAGSLTKIIFPTGGYREYIFESNTYYDVLANKNQYGGGLRIARIEHKPNSQADAIIKNYFYDTETTISGSQAFQSSGKVYAPPIFGEATNYFQRPETIGILTTMYKPVAFCPDGNAGCNNIGTQGFRHKDYIFNDFDIWNHYTKRSTQPYNSVTDRQGNSVLYTQIKEEFDGETNGYTIHYFNEPETYDHHQTEIRRMFKTVPNISRSWAFDFPPLSNPISRLTLIIDDPIHQIPAANGGTNHGCMYEANLQREGFGISPYPPMSRTVANLGLHRGKIDKIEIFNSNGDKVQSTEYDYITYRDDDELVYGVTYKALDAICVSVSGFPYGLRQDIYNWSKYHYVTNADSQVSRITTKFFDVGNESKYVTTIQDLYYENHPDNSLLSKQETTNSNGEKEITKTYYPQDSEVSSFSYVQELINEHRIATPLKQQKFLEKDNNLEFLLSTQENHYDIFSGNYLQKTLRSSKGGESPEIDLTINQRDDLGNILEYTKTNDIPYVIIWGYQKSYPIAKIENATYAQVTTAIQALHTDYNTLAKIQTLSNNDNNRSIGESSSGEGKLRKALNALRKSSTLVNAQISTYTYDPLVGMTSMTDSKGRTVYYNYDDLNRLQSTKDHNGNILSENIYNYKN